MHEASHEHDNGLPASDPFLCVKHRDDYSIIPLVGRSAWNIGRERQCQIVVEDSKASRKHAMLFRQEDGSFCLVDRGSSNGTFVNGRRLETPIELRAGDQISIGEVEAVFYRPGPCGEVGTEDRSSHNIETTVRDLKRESASILMVDRALEKIVKSELRALRAENKEGRPLTFDELMAFYQDAGFLYPAKLEAMAPRMDAIRRTWDGLLRGNDDVFKILVCREVSGQKVVISNSICSFEYTPGTWQTQHLVSARRMGLTGTLTMLLGMNNWLAKNPGVQRLRLTYRPSNPGVARLFAGFAESVPGGLGSLQVLDYLFVPLTGSVPPTAAGDDGVKLVGLDAGSQTAVGRFLQSRLHPVDLEALRLEDPQLAQFRERVAEYGLQRERTILAATMNDAVVGACVCNLASEGINFSFLESEVSPLTLAQDLDEGAQRAVVSALLKAAAEYYRSRGRDYMVLMLDPALRQVREALGYVGHEDKQYGVLTIACRGGALEGVYQASIRYYRDHLVRAKDE